MTSDELKKFARSYAEAWCSHKPEMVSAFFAPNASISVNDGEPAPIGQVAQAFIRDFPDLIVKFDRLEPEGDRVAFHWTLTGTHAGTGNKVQISGYELWKIDDNGLISESQGHFDARDYESQVRGSNATFEV